MSLEKEAKDFVARRNDYFEQGVQKRIEALDKYLTDNLYHTTETREAIKHLITVQMWANRSSRLNGVKK
jgi:molybdate-binding protein